MNHDGENQKPVRAHQWRGIIEEYRSFFDFAPGCQPVTLHEGGTPLLYARQLSERTGAEVYIKYEGMNPTASFKDRGMTVAMTAAVRDGARTVICASTGNTSASAAAYATRAGIECAVLVPAGRIAVGKMSQALAHGARLIEVNGSFDDCLRLCRKLEESYPVHLVNSVNPYRISGQRTGAFEVVDSLGQAPDIHILPVGNAGNITAYWKGYKDYYSAGHCSSLPAMWGFQAAGAAPLVLGHPVDEPDTIATAIRIGHPASWTSAIAARDESEGLIEAVTDEQILLAHREISHREGIFIEPGSAASIAGLLAKAEAGEVPRGVVIVCTVTGHGLKDPQWAIRAADGEELEPERVDVDVVSAAKAMALEKG